MSWWSMTEARGGDRKAKVLQEFLWYVTLTSQKWDSGRKEFPLIRVNLRPMRSPPLHRALSYLMTKDICSNRNPITPKWTFSTVTFEKGVTNAILSAVNFTKQRDQKQREHGCGIVLQDPGSSRLNTVAEKDHLWLFNHSRVTRDLNWIKFIRTTEWHWGEVWPYNHESLDAKWVADMWRMILTLRWFSNSTISAGFD